VCRLSIAFAHLVSAQAADDRSGHVDADVDVTLREAFPYNQVLADLARRRGGCRLADRFAADDGGVQLFLLGDRLDVHHVGVGDATAVGDAVVLGGVTLYGFERGRLVLQGGGVDDVVGRARMLEGRDRSAADQKRG